MQIRLACIAALILAGACASNSGQTAPSPTSGPLSADERAFHALDRLAFGPRPGDVNRVAAMGVDRWMDEQLQPESIDDSVSLRRLALLETQRKSARELIADHPEPQEIQNRFPKDTLLLRRAQQSANQLVAQIQNAPVLRALTTERQLQEVMTAFWENHFSVSFGKSPNRYAIADYDRAIRAHALGKFRDLLGVVAKSPTMLFYLDNWQSSVDSVHSNVDEQPIDMRRAQSDDSLVRAMAMLPRRRPRGLNENYARELLELHTLGVDGGYSQKDVEEVARALTGWTISAPQLGAGFVFRPELHDASAKVVLGHHLAAGRGMEDGEDVLDIVARHPATAHFIVTKLARHFVSDDPPSSLVDRCAAEFTKSDGDIRETMRCIAHSPEFFSRAAYRAKVKTPFELVASSLRAMNAAPDTAARWAGLVAQLGQPMFGHLTPEGWPDRGEAWMNTGAVLNRINFAQRLSLGQVAGVRRSARPDSVALALGSPAFQRR